MTLTKEVKITVDSVIESLDDFGAPEGEPEKMTASHTAHMKTEGDTVTLSYSESSEGGKCETELVLIGETVTLKRTGAIETVMRFAPGEHYSTVYSIPPYSFDAEIVTRRLTNSFKDKGLLEIKYIMTVGGAKRRTVLRISLWS